MANIAINDLTASEELDRAAMAVVLGGRSPVSGYRDYGGYLGGNASAYPPLFAFAPVPVALSKEITFAQSRSRALNVSYRSDDNVYLNKKFTYIRGF